jgi:GxxExxY protein
MENHNFRTLIESLSKDIYHQLGPGHNECVYQKALVLELYNHGATSVESEKNVPVFYVDSRQVTHTVGTERIDILARFGETVVLIETKAHTAGIRDHVEIPQLRKYITSLRTLGIVPTVSCVMNFPQKHSSMEFYFLSK